MTIMRSTKSLADAIGLPDEQDKLRIQAFFDRYEREYPGEIAHHISYHRALHEANALADPRLAKYGEVNKAARGRVTFELPVAIGQWLGQAYPLMFRDKKHAEWFRKNFKQYSLHDQYTDFK